ncbi:MAG: hypothetical protein LBI53_03475 [Candidatus Peribacteria bacterium]|nr:hypothetical protein [Candidatus Peribacteria bacterium]
MKNTDSLDINIAGAEMEGNIHASIQGTQNLTTNAFQQNLDLNMKLKNTTYYNPFSLDVALKMGLIMKDSNLYLQFNAATGTLVE